MRAGGPAVCIGGASGIGASVAARLRDGGADVVVWDVNPPHDVRCDVCDPEQVEGAAEATIERLGVPATVTVSAGISRRRHAARCRGRRMGPGHGHERPGAWLVMRALARPMSEGHGGSMVAVSSVSAQLPDRSMGLDCASKAALDMVVRVAAIEWGPRCRRQRGGARRHRHAHARCDPPDRAPGWPASAGAPPSVGSGDPMTWRKPCLPSTGCPG